MQALRRYKLAQLLEVTFKGDRGKFLKAAGITKGRLSQLLEKTQPFGDVAAKRLCTRLELEPGFFDTLDAQTVEFAVKFDALPDHVKDKWLELVALLGKQN